MQTGDRMRITASDRLMKRTMKNRQETLHYHLMLLPGMALLFLFNIVPMFGVLIAFQRFIPARGIFGSRWVGLDNFAYMFQLPDSRQIFANTLIIAVSKIVIGLLASILFTLLLNELRARRFKRLVQTVAYLPHFLSWVILAGVIGNLLSLHGVVNQILGLFGLEPTMFLTSNVWFRLIIIISDVWKEFGFNAVVFLAALSSIDPGLYEAADIDGANRLKKILHVTLPGLGPTIILVSTLSLSSVLNANFDQVFNLYSPLVYATGDIIDTYVYRTGLLDVQYGLATAVGLLKSAVSFILIVASYKLAGKFANYEIF
jgi:putative aldouronate transport system permease protein